MNGRGSQRYGVRRCHRIARSDHSVGGMALPTRLLGSVLVVELLVAVLLVVDGVRGGLASWTGARGGPRGPRRGRGAAHRDRTARRADAPAGHAEPARRPELGVDLRRRAAAPPLLAGVSVVVIYLHLYLRVWRPTRIPVYRWAFTATVLLAVHAPPPGRRPTSTARTCSSRARGLAIVTALLCYTAVNTCLVVGAIVLSA